MDPNRLSELTIDSNDLGLSQESRALLGDLVIFVGLNNAGKTNLLRYIRRKFSGRSDIISAQRYRTSDDFPPVINAEEQRQSEKNNRQGIDGSENIGLDPIRTLALLNGVSQKKVVSEFNRLFPDAPISVERDEDYPTQLPRVKVSGKKPSQQGTGWRTSLSVLISILDPANKVICIDEPELSLEPHVQKKLFKLIHRVTHSGNKQNRKQIFIATHSHLFVDKEHPKNNYRVIRDANGLTSFEKLAHEADISSIVFELLGNSISDLLLPSSFILVEGESDRIYLNEILKRLGNSKKIAILQAGGDAKARKAHMAFEEFWNQFDVTGVAKNRIYALLDRGSRHNRNALAKRLGRKPKRLFVLRVEGIELAYPKKALEKITSIAPREQSAALQKEMGKHILGLRKFNGTKIELAKRIVTEKWEVEAVPGEILKCLKTAMAAARNAA